MSFEPRDPQLTGLLAQAALDGLPTQQMQPATLPNLLHMLSTQVLGRRVTVCIDGSDCVQIDVQGRRILRVADLRAASDHVVTPGTQDDAAVVLDLLKGHLDGSCLMQLVPDALPAPHNPSAPGLAVSHLGRIAGQNMPDAMSVAPDFATLPGVLCHARVQNAELTDLQGDPDLLDELQARAAPLLPSLRDGETLFALLSPQGQLAYPTTDHAALVVSVSQDVVTVALMPGPSAQAYCNAVFER